MKLKLDAQATPPAAIVLNETCVVSSLADGLDLIGNADYLGARQIVAKDLHFSSEFFDLKTGLAGEVLQKFANYRMKLKITGNWREVHSKALRDFIRECNRGEAIEFLQV
jgi:hypothetical protein